MERKKAKMSQKMARGTINNFHISIRFMALSPASLSGYPAFAVQVIRFLVVRSPITPIGVVYHYAPADGQGRFILMVTLL